MFIKRGKYHTKILLGALFALPGIIFISVGIFIYVSFLDFKKTAVPGTAVITDITSYTKRDSDGDLHRYHNVYVEYEIDGIQYNEKFPVYTSDMREGQQIDILYDPDNPREIHGESDRLFFILVFAGIGSGFFIIGAILVALELKNRFRIKRLVELNHMVIANIIEISMNISVSMTMNGAKHRPCYLLCEWKNPANGNIYNFKSDGVLKDLENVLSDSAISSIPVYIDPESPSNYHVSLDFMRNPVISE